MTTVEHSPPAAPPDLGRVPPHDLEAERQLLGSMMLNHDAIGEVLPIIPRSESSWFYRSDHRKLFEFLVDLYDADQPCDLVVVSNELKRRSLLEEVGGLDALIGHTERVGTWSHAPHYAKIVRDKGLLRDVIRAAGRISESAYADTENTSDLLDKAEQELFKVTERRVSGQAILLSELVKEVWGQIDERGDRYLSGLPTGFHELDDLTSGFQPGDFIIVAGRPSMGKTAFGLTVAEYMAVEDERPVVFFSMEMSRVQVAHRVLCSRSRVDSHKVRRRTLSQEEALRIAHVCERLQSVPLYIDDTPGMSILELRAKARRLKMQHDIAAVFVDYLQLMRCPAMERQGRQQEIAMISLGLKALGRELNIPIITMAQLNRAAEMHEGNRPRMSNLRESGAIEQDADVVLLLHREEYYKPTDESAKNIAEIIIAKQRNGPTDTVKLVFNKKSTRFDNYSPVPEPEHVSETEGDAPF